VMCLFEIDGWGSSGLGFPKARRLTSLRYVAERFCASEADDISLCNLDSSTPDTSMNTTYKHAAARKIYTRLYEACCKLCW